MHLCTRDELISWFTPLDNSSTLFLYIFFPMMFSDTFPDAWHPADLNKLHNTLVSMVSYTLLTEPHLHYAALTYYQYHVYSPHTYCYQLHFSKHKRKTYQEYLTG